MSSTYRIRKTNALQMHDARGAALRISQSLRPVGLATAALAASLLSLATLGCSSGPSPFGTTAPIAESDEPLSCRWDEVGKASSAAPPRRASANEPMSAPAGQMTEEAAQAKRLFDSERFEEATKALTRVVNGETGDDQGNREVAQYHLGIAHFRLGRFDDALEVFVAIAAQPSHLKFQETALWLSRLVDKPAQAVRAIDALYPYSRETVARFDNPQQRDTYATLMYATGRSALRHGDTAEAAARFQLVPAGRFAGLAAGCQRFAPAGVVAK